MERWEDVVIHPTPLPAWPPSSPGENEQARLAIRAPAIKGRGVRVLSLDGGGMRGLCTVSAEGALMAWPRDQAPGRIVCIVFTERTAHKRLSSRGGSRHLDPDPDPDPDPDADSSRTASIQVQMLRQLERRLGGRPLSSMFDLVVGTSTGAILAVSLGVLRYTLDQCERTYTDLGHKIFNNQVRGGAQKPGTASCWLSPSSRHFFLRHRPTFPRSHPNKRF